MMNNNKILTVSYGTFSCTLEGFDDSFGTMKAIAEYFRDLAADDRYFGAEPPQPDAEMLARIAQKEVSRRVQAREQDGKIILSAIEDQVAPVPLAPAAVAAPADAVEPASQVTDGAASPPEHQDLSAEISTAATDLDMPDLNAPQKSVTEATTQETELAVTDALAIATEMPETEMPEVETASDEKIDLVAVAEPEFIEDENDIVPGQPDADVEAFFAESSAATIDTLDEDDADAAAQTAPVGTVTAPAAVAAPDAPAPDSIAAKLQRIRAVVAQHEEADDEDDYLEDEHAEAETAQGTSADDVIADARADIEDALEADATSAEEAENKTSSGSSDDDDVSAILSRLENTVKDQSAVVTEDVSKALEDVTLAELDDTPDEPSVEDTVSNLFEDDTALHEEKPATSSPRARVIKVKRADLEAAIDKGDLEEYGDDLDETESPDPIEDTVEPGIPQPPKLDDLAPSRGNKQSTLSEEDAAELARELSELEGENTEPAPQAAPAQRPLRRADAGRHTLPAIDESAETDVNRLLAETDHQMGEPESATRRDAFAHLRAAVASKKADVAMGGSGKTEESDDAYREDLAEVVRPRRPASTSVRTERPGQDRPAPLKLVAEQRIDVQKPVANAGPVRPRRIAAAAEEVLPTSDGESFTDFAAEMGASTLPQLLEAAAAYMSFVEGHDQFSRPQLMTKVRQAGGPDGFSREEGLRSFGQLLRAGKIEKIKGGRFTVSDDIGYRPDERAVG